MEFWKKVYGMYRPFRGPMVAVFGFIIAVKATSLVSPYLLGRVIDGVTAHRPIEGVLLLALALALAMFVPGVVLMLLRERFEISHTDYAIPLHVNNETFAKLFRFSIGQHISENSGLKQSTVQRGKGSLTELAYMVLYHFIPTCIEVTFLIGALLYYSAELGAIVALGTAVYVWFIVRTNLRFKGDVRKLEQMTRRDAKFQGEVLRNMELVLSSAQESRALRECGESYGRIAEFSQNLWLRFSWTLGLRGTVIILTRLLLLAAGIVLAYRGRYTVGELVMFVSWSSEALGGASTISGLHRKYLQLRVAVQRYFGMLSIEPDVKVVPNPVRPERFEGRIEFKNVTFRYRCRDVDVMDPDEEWGNEPLPERKPADPALMNVSFVIKPGETVAIVGESGSGKTTLVQALIRAQDPEEGQVIIDGNDLRVLDLKKFRESIGIVDQEVSLFDHTLRYNITYGLNGKSGAVTNADLDRIATMSCIDRFFPRLEHGYDTIIGERGIKLSGGEKQRVGIARALIKNPDILIFDEATSNLDPMNEWLIRDSIRKAARGRTTIIIAHRFSTIKEVDRVLVFSKGCLVGEGTHVKLARTCEPYRNLVKHQVRML